MAEENYKLSGTPQEGLWGATIGFFIGFAAVVAMGATAPEFKAALQLSGFLAGLLVAMPNLSGSLLRIPFSAWTDEVGGRKPILILLLLSIVGLIGLYFLGLSLENNSLTNSSYPLLLLFGFLAGCGIATFSVGISQVSYWFKQSEQGSALGKYAGIGNLAPGIFSFIMAISLATMGVAKSYLLWLVLLIIGTVIYYYMGKDAWSFQLKDQGVEKSKAEEIARKHGQELFPKYKLVDSLKASGRHWETWALVGLYFTSFGGFIALGTWFKTYWVELFSPSPINLFDDVKLGMALILNGIFIVVGSLMRVYTGQLSDKIGGYKTLYGGIAILILGSLILIFDTSSYSLAIVGMIILALGMGAMNAAVFKLVPKAVPDAVGGTSGWVGGLGAFGGFVIPPILGFFVDQMGTVGYARGYVVFTILGIICFLLTWLLHRAVNNH